ncbi:MAG: methylated-DNA--[protein]-cysteine S-methyltransferase [Candidatus Thiodiazotropha sp. (ex Epidulcina cf. delphinae)]|nr:methylated-DNA--[protein]-cysteine S-methyltransferase [Candidatus Thiodiazotropha sp. (ex Epidulcina cf. delphinae)]
MNPAKSNFQAVISLPFGPVGIAVSEGRLQAIEYLSSPQKRYRSKAPGLDLVIDAIEAYLDDPGRRFKLDLILHGTAFQQRVWRALQAIPPGKPLTYGQLAEKIGSGARAVGNACRANPCPLVVPCHRVVGANGLGGFAGERGGEKLVIKRWLLRHEGWL